jgi:2-polyprenyl-6-methoxyphenol hydroxylase-like FAD-dependent oxidoreductase
VVEYETGFVSADQHDDWVNVTVEQKGEPIKIRASFVAGCDGARSKVRDSMNLGLEGGEYRAAFMLADIETNGLLPADQMTFCPSEFGPVAIFPLNASRRRIVATIEHAEGDAPSIDLVRKILAQRAPSGIEARELHWSSYFHIHHRHAPRLRVGRMFIAGERSSHSQPIWRAGHEHRIA